MLHNMRSMRFCAAWLIGLFLSSHHAAAWEKLSDNWDFVIAPYALAPTITGDAALGRAGAPVDVDSGDILSVLQFGGVIHGEARHKSGFGIVATFAGH